MAPSAAPVPMRRRSTGWSTSTASNRCRPATRSGCASPIRTNTTSGPKRSESDLADARRLSDGHRKVKWISALSGRAVGNDGNIATQPDLEPTPAMPHDIEPIGYLRSCFREKFAIPRQPHLAPAARGVLELLPPFDSGEAVAGLEQVSHVWLLFLFHQALEDKPRLRVRPPRLGGNRMVGVFATRATHRPNGIGQSVVRLDRVEAGRLLVSGIDLLDGTPIIDIKPYVPYADALPEARNEMAAAAPELIEVQW